MAHILKIDVFVILCFCNNHDKFRNGVEASAMKMIML